MSHVNSTVSSQKSAIYSAIASFAGMLAAIPVSLALFSAAQPAQAMQQPAANNDATYAQYMKAYSDGFAASASGGNCGEQVQATAAKESAPEAHMATLASHHKTSKSKHHYQPMSPKEWKQTVNNSYNHSTTTNKTYKYTKNINSNNTVNSNNKASSTVNVIGDGAAVNSSANAGGVSSTNQVVSNVASNNDVEVKDSFNTDSHDTTKTVTKTTTNTTTNTNSNNDIEVNVGSKNKIDASKTYVNLGHKHPTHI